MFPAAIVRSLRTPPLQASAFTPTKFHTTEDKAWFGNTLLKFIADDCPRSAFTDRFYSRLSNSFGNIAHFNKFGFYEHFFFDLSGKIDFLEQTVQWPCCGDPEYTFCDIEMVIQARLTASNLPAFQKARRVAELNRRERELLARLKAKCEPQPQPAPTATLRQQNLFDSSAR